MGAISLMFGTATRGIDIPFVDPDFLNAPPHSLRIVAAVHERFPAVTFDCTVKVEHVLRHADLWPGFALALQAAVFLDRRRR